MVEFAKLSLLCLTFDELLKLNAKYKINSLMKESFKN